MKIDRLVSIIMLLLQRDRVGSAELAQMFDVSLRTIYRDIDTINLAGIPILSTPGVSGGFEIMQNYKIEKKVFSTNDISAILMGLSSLSGMIRGDEVFNALAKVKSFIPKESAKEIELQSNQILVDLTPWMGNKNISAYIELVKIAMKKKQYLSFSYVDHHGNITKRKAEPIQLVLKNNQWYLYCFCNIRNDFRLFKISRIMNMKILETCFKARPYKKPILDVSKISIPHFTNVKLRVHSSILERILDLCTFESLIRDQNDYYIANIPFIENDYYYGLLISLADKCECLEPLSVRKEVFMRIQKMEKLYKNNLIV